MGNLKPLRGYILVEQVEDELKTSSGIALPESSKDKPSKGIVLDISSIVSNCAQCNLEYQGKGLSHILGTNCGWLESPVSKGDKVVFKKWSVTDLEEDGKKLAFVKFEDILGKYEQ